MTATEWSGLVQNLGFPMAALFAVIYGFLSGKLVTRREFDQAIKRGDDERVERIKLQEQVTRLLEAQAATVERLSNQPRTRSTR